MSKTINFLRDIYSVNCEEGDYVILAARSETAWKDYPIKYNSKTLADDLKDFFRSYPASQYDLYWSPHPYKKPRRLIENSIDTKFMAQDIDEAGHPEDLNPRPSFWWQSSPNKYQGLWELDRYISETEYTPVNEQLAHFIGADDCWDFPHVYRIPGTVNHKYKNAPTLGEAYSTGEIYRPKNIQKLIGFRNKPEPTKATNPSDLTERKIYAKYSIPQKVRDLLALDDLDGVDRSNTIWYIENKLYELGMEPNEIMHLVKHSVFNKYSGRKDEDKRLRAELDKIISGSVTTEIESPKNTPTLRLASYQSVMGSNSSFDGWLVKGFWGRRSHGIVAGMPKTMKSTLTHDLAISVASGKPFLGKYGVLDPGPVIVIQNENADYIMRDRTEKLLVGRGLTGQVNKSTQGGLTVEFPPELPIYFINQQGFSISNEEHRKQLEEMVAEIQPVLIIFDPLYLMFEGDINSAQDLNPALNWLLSLKNTYSTAVILVHHYNKGGSNQAKGGARMAGSIFLYGWIESAWYLSKEEDDPDPEDIDGSEEESSMEPRVVNMSREFRMSGAFPDIDIHISMGEIGSPEYKVDVTLAGKEQEKLDVDEMVMNILNTSSAPRTSKELRDLLGVPKATLRKVLQELNESKKVTVKDGGYVSLVKE